jgi:alpha-mannosidase
VVTAVKQTDSGSGYILRAYEANGQPAEGRLTACADIASVHEATLLEKPGPELQPDAIPFRPYEIKTLRIVLGPRR